MSEKQNPFLQLDKIILSIKSPCAISDCNGEIIFSNKEFSAKFGSSSIQNIVNLFNINFDRLIEEKLVITNNKFRLSLHELEIDKKLHYLIFVEQFNGINYSEADFKLLNHDLNNIFTGILNNAVMIKQNATENKSSLYITGIENGVARASSILDSFLSVETRLSSSNSKIDLVKLISEVIASLNNFISEKISFSFTHPEDIFIYGDFNNIFRAIQNICINSIEAIKDKGKINIALLTDNNKKLKNISLQTEYVKISISDSGSGISKSNLNKIFEKGFSTKNKKRESGLGLSSVKKIIEQHKGFIEVKSKLNIGTEFVLYFPVYKTSGNSVLNFAKKINIIVADDEENILELLNDLFLSYNFDVTTARNGEEVLEILNKDKHFDLIVIDRKMPVVDGIECIKKIKAKKIKLKIILTTGSPAIKLDMKQLSKYGVVEVLPKPYDFNYLLELVRRIIPCG